MADESQEPFDLERITKLVELMEQHDLREVKLKRGDQKWILRRGAQEVVPVAPAAMAPVAPPGPAVPAQATAAAETKSDDGTLSITSPMVGTFYRAASPDEPPFVKQGDKVTPDTAVCLIEAMKFFNQIKAEHSGTIVKIHVNDGDAVDFGQPLFQVKPE